MKILLLNPNMSSSMTEAMSAVARQVAAPGTEVIGVTAQRGFPYISSRAEAQIAGHLVLEMIAAHQADVDAVIIAAFGDPGLGAARELFDLPVVGMAEAAMFTACQLGERFAYVTFSTQLGPWYQEGVRATQLQARFAGVRTPAQGFRSVTDVQAELRTSLIDLVNAAAFTDKADVVILGGAPLAGMAATIEDAPAVLVDPISAAICQAEALVRLAPRGASAGSFARPPGKPATGLDPMLALWMARTQAGPLSGQQP